MPSVLRLRLTAELLAVTPTNPHFVFLTEGSIIQTSDDLAEPGLRHVRFEGKDLLAFTRDILERTEELNTEVLKR